MSLSIWHWLVLCHIFFNRKKKLKINNSSRNRKLYVRSWLVIIERAICIITLYRTHIICQNLIIIIYIKNGSKFLWKSCEPLKRNKIEQSKTYKIEGGRRKKKYGEYLFPTNE